MHEYSPSWTVAKRVVCLCGSYWNLIRLKSMSICVLVLLQEFLAQSKLYPSWIKKCSRIFFCYYYPCQKNTFGEIYFKEIKPSEALAVFIIPKILSNIYPLIYELICLKLTLLVSTATSEYAFSTMKMNFLLII